MYPNNLSLGEGHGGAWGVLGVVHVRELAAVELDWQQSRPSMMGINSQRRPGEV